MTESDLINMWKPWQRILFRFFFVFFSLEVLTQDFMGNWLGGNLFIWDLGAKLFTSPTLWLNKNIFHFNYHPDDWTTFSGSLVLVRDISYFFLSSLICVLWTFLDKRRNNYEKLNFWFGKILTICLACTMVTYGLLKVFPVQMKMPGFVDLYMPVGDYSPFDLVWTTFGYGKPYQMFSGIAEVLGAMLILFKRTKSLGLILLLVILSNVIMINYTYVVGVLQLSMLLFLIVLFLFIPYIKNLRLFFFSEAIVNQFVNLPDYQIKNKFKKYAVTFFSFFLVGITILLNLHRSYSLYIKNEHIKNSEKYSLVKNFVINNDTLKNLIIGDTIRWRFWNERIVNGKSLVTLNVMDNAASKTYFLVRDTIKKTATLVPLYKKDASPINFECKWLDENNWHLEGLMNGKYISADLQKINPDSIFKLLKIKREIFAIDKNE